MTHTTPTNGAQPRRPNKWKSSSQVVHPHPRRTSKKRKRRPFDLNRQRRRDIARLVVHRHGRLPNADACKLYMKAAAWHCPSGNRRHAMEQWCAWVCTPPSLDRQIDAILSATPPRRIRADPLARHLHVTDAERTALRIFTIGAYDVPKAERIKRRKEKRRLADQARRQARGAKPHEQSISRTKPWEARGMSRATWYRKEKAMRQPVRQIRGHDSSLSHGRGPVSLSTGKDGESVPSLSAARARSVPNGNGKSNGEHGARRRSRPPMNEGTSTHPLATTTPRPSHVVHLEAVGIG